MTITNHVRRIQDLADQVIAHVDDREYAQAHEDLEYIEIRVRLAHEHVRHLQQVNSRNYLKREKASLVNLESAPDGS